MCVCVCVSPIILRNVMNYHETILRHPTCPFCLGTRKKRSTYRFLLDRPKNARPPKNARQHPLIPSRGRRDCYVKKNTRLRIFALVLRIFALVLHFDFCSLLLNIQRPIILEDRPARFWQTRSKQEKVYVYHILVPGFAIRLG